MPGNLNPINLLMHNILYTIYYFFQAPITIINLYRLGMNGLILRYFIVSLKLVTCFDLATTIKIPV